jgi:hypothetical protein
VILVGMKNIEINVLNRFFFLKCQKVAKGAA